MSYYNIFPKLTNTCNVVEVASTSYSGSDIAFRSIIYYKLD